MKIYLDDNWANKALVEMLRKAGHTIVLPAEVGLRGASDARHLTCAIGAGLATLTADSEDFLELDALILSAGGTHPGILVVRFDSDPRHDMKPKHIVAALANLEQSGMNITSQVVVLNQWR
jgi:predicted nuclease of predicted toxin-antitoxin system